jgi:hypothetical protein
MDLNDLKIKKLIIALKDRPPDEGIVALEELKKEIGLYIYSFPAMAYRKDRDICSDFYLYLQDRLDKVLTSFPREAEVRFKTWFNYVLRNQYHNFSYYRARNKVPCVSLDEDSVETPSVSFELDGDEPPYGDLEAGLGRIGEWDRVLIRVFYMPETVRGDDVKEIVRQTGLTVTGVLEVLRELVSVHGEDLERKRGAAAKIGEVNRKLTELKYRLVRYRGRDVPVEELSVMNELLGKVARLEAARSRLIRGLGSPDKNVTAVFSRLFRDRPGAVRRLDLARKKLRFEMLKIKKINQKAG